MTKEEKITVQNALKQLIDQWSLRDVLEALAHVSHTKAEQSRAQWQESLTAKRWDLDATVIDNMAPAIFN
jgi:ElaB/YqjD/DUF883 family membrane-anchored ribosome-binding protein